jgi:adenylate cyclase
LVNAVLSRRGEVLKFIGDGLLAVFPFAAFEDKANAAVASFDAAEEALSAMGDLKAEPPAAAPNWHRPA